MARQLTETLVGALVIAAAVGFLLHLNQSTGAGAGGDSYPVTASFRAADGVRVGTDVRVAGVKIGSVTSLELNPRNYRAEVEITVSGEIEIPDDSVAVISSEGLLGGNYVEIHPGGSPINVEAGGEIIETQSSVSLIQLLLQFAQGGSE